MIVITYTWTLHIDSVSYHSHQVVWNIATNHIYFFFMFFLQEPGLLSSMLYRRLPCLKHNNLFVLQLTCPGLGCCLYNSVNVGSLLLSGVASSSSTSGNTHNIFCPYRFASIPGFPDLSESVGDCCELKTCYHPNNSVSMFSKFLTIKKLNILYL